MQTYIGKEKHICRRNRKIKGQIKGVSKWGKKIFCKDKIVKNRGMGRRQEFKNLQTKVSKVIAV